ncbi:CHRD domain-containing protein [Bacillus sp. 3103sda1]|nr:CHRD domain-containing protein [Bacillus sp. 3103sda1]
MHTEQYPQDEIRGQIQEVC